MRFRCLFIEALALLAALTAQAPLTSATESRHSSGLVVIENKEFTDNVPDVPDAVSQAYELAIQASEQYPDDLAYPWLDIGTNRVIVNATTPAGLERARQITTLAPAVPRPQGGAESQIATREEPTVLWNVQQRGFSRTRLEQIKEEITDLVPTAVLPDADLISAIAPDPEHTRIRVTVKSISDNLLYALAARYGTEAIAVEVDPTEVQLDSRQNDTQPFYGGAAIGIYVPIYVSGIKHDERTGFCTSGVPWQIDSSHVGMLTAGHCAVDGKTVYPWTFSNQTGDRSQYIGQLVQGYDNFRHDRGTILFSGQAVYRGDVGMIGATPRKVSGVIYVGGRFSSASRDIGDMWGRSPHVNEDQYCTGGAVSGEVCHWKVVNVGMNLPLSKTVTLRNVVQGNRRGSCIQQGDSGGPVYTVWGDGRVSMKGIISAGGGGGIKQCRNYFTDLRVAFYGLPGRIRLP